MQFLKIMPYTFVFICFGSLAVAQDDFFEPSFYLGANIGVSDYEDLVLCSNCGNEDRFDKTDENALTLGILGGYRFNRFLAAEVGFYHLGTATFDIHNEETGRLSRRLKTESRGIRAAAKGIIPIGARVELFGKLGAHYYDIDNEFSTVASSDNPRRAIARGWNGTELFYAGGVDVTLGPAWSLGLGFENYVGDTGDFENNSLEEDDIDRTYSYDLPNITLGVMYRF